MESEYNWGVDGFGRCSICKQSDMVILFTGLPKVPGDVVLEAYLNNGMVDCIKAKKEKQ